MFKEKAITCGVVIKEKIDNTILICHATNSKFWSIPKGMFDKKEDIYFKNAAIREVKEETGLILNKEETIYLGNYDYLPHKNLVLFLNIFENKVNTKELKCTSYFNAAYSKEMLPEVDKYLWVKVEDLKKYLNLKQFNIIDSIKNLIS